MILHVWHDEPRAAEEFATEYGSEAKHAPYRNEQGTISIVPLVGPFSVVPHDDDPKPSFTCPRHGAQDGYDYRGLHLCSVPSPDGGMCHEPLAEACLGCGETQDECANDCGARLAGGWER